MIPYSTQSIDEDDIRAVVRALKGEFITQGSKVEEFEQKIADFVGAKYAITFNSATSALNVAYKIIKICETSALGMQFRTCENFGDFADSKSSLNPQNSHKYKSHTAIQVSAQNLCNLGSLESNDSRESKKFFAYFFSKKVSGGWGEAPRSLTFPSPSGRGQGGGVSQNPNDLRDSQILSESQIPLDSHESNSDSSNSKADSRKSKSFLPTFFKSRWAWAKPIKNISPLPFVRGGVGGGVNSPKIEFLTTPLTFCATANMMLENGITPRFCDIDALGNIDINKLRLSPHTRAIVSVDYAGNSVDAESIARICKENNLYFISDSSHSFGGALNGRKIGTFADMTIFSFHALKPITTMEGGAITTNNKTFYHLAKLIRSHCIIKGDLWDSEILDLDGVFGHNFRASDVACALGISQLKKLESFLALRQKTAKIYDEAFKNDSRIQTLKIPQNITPTYHLYPILLDSALIRHKAAIFRALREANIGVQVHYKPIYQFAPYKNHAPLPNVDNFYNAEISIPCHQKMSENDADFVITTLQKILSKF